MESGERQEQIIKIYLWATCSEITSSYWRWVLSWRTPANPHLCLSSLRVGCYVDKQMMTKNLITGSFLLVWSYQLFYLLQASTTKWVFLFLSLPSLPPLSKERKENGQTNIKKHPTLLCLCFVHFTQFSIQRMGKNESFQRPLQ